MYLPIGLKPAVPVVTYAYALSDQTFCEGSDPRITDDPENWTTLVLPSTPIINNSCRSPIARCTTWP
jgi:hypothetical protein